MEFLLSNKSFQAQKLADERARGFKIKIEDPKTFYYNHPCPRWLPPRQNYKTLPQKLLLTRRETAVDEQNKNGCISETSKLIPSDVVELKKLLK